MGIDRSTKNLSTKDPSIKFLRPSKRRQQVAAVCYRTGKCGVEFLLVQTRSGRWIFPKGGVEPGLTHAQSAALEAFEEAGVHGRIEEIPFARYFRRAPDAADQKSGPSELAVATHLCEVTRLERPQESNRKPTWFAAEKTKQNLIKNRAPEFGIELARVIDRALSRINRLQAENERAPDWRKDSLQKACFEFSGNGRSLNALQNAGMVRKFLGPRAGAVLRLGTGRSSPAQTTRNVTAIDSGRKPSVPKPNNFSTNKHKAAGKL